jgi:hypothetical protein
MGKFGLSNISTVIEDALKKRLIDSYEVLKSRFSRRGMGSGSCITP